MFQLAYNVKLFMILYLMFNWNYFKEILNKKNGYNFLAALEKKISMNVLHREANEYLLQTGI